LGPKDVFDFVMLAQSSMAESLLIVYMGFILEKLLAKTNLAA